MLGKRFVNFLNRPNSEDFKNIYRNVTLKKTELNIAAFVFT